MITEPLGGLEAWVKYLSQVEVPVLRQTRNTLEQFAADQDNVAERALAAAVMHDPLMALKVLAYLQAHRRRSQTADITTIGRAIMMLGIGPFFRNFAELKVAEERLHDRPQALLGLLKVVNRSRKASQFARDWAVQRHDLDVEEITVATLLHDSAEMVLWCFAPDLLLRIRALQAEDRQLRSREAQRRVLGVTGRELQQALCQAWHLPELLQSLMDERNESNPRIRNVVLAVNLARHAANGWDDPALPDDFREIGALLHLPAEVVRARVGAPGA